MAERNKLLSVDDFIDRALSIQEFEDLVSLRHDAIATENYYRELFARKRDNWEVPELDENFHYLIDVFSKRGDANDTQNETMGRTAISRMFSKYKASHPASIETENPVNNGKSMVEVFRCLPRFDQDEIPRAFPLQNRREEGTFGIVPSLDEFHQSWNSLTEDCLRFLDWNNVLAAGGAVAGCLAPLPKKILDVKGFGPQRMARRKYFHDEYLPGSDIDLFLYGISEDEAKDKLLEIYDAVQAASPFPVRAFRSTHAITLVSQYPFRHVQIVLRIYNSASEILCGFDVDSCAVGYDGTKVVLPPRTAISIITQSNMVDMSRRSPSYEMRLAKYASRGYEIIVPSLQRDRVDPFIFEKRLDTVKGLSRLLLLEKLRTPEERLRYRIERQMKSKGTGNWRLLSRLRQLESDRWNLNRQEGTEGVPLRAMEASDYSTVFLPWGPEWTASRIERQMKKKDIALNRIEFKDNGEIKESERSYKIHVCAFGTMEEVMKDPYPDDPPLPKDVPSDVMDSLVHGEVSWLVDNPGRQQIGSFHPITDEDWKEGAYFSVAAEKLTKAAATNDVAAIECLFEEEKIKDDGSTKYFLLSKDFLGRSTLHLAALSGSIGACEKLLEHPLADRDYLNARLPDGRTALHIAAMKGNVEISKLILEKRIQIAEILVESVHEVDNDVLFDVMDIDGADWENKLSPLQYSIVLGQVEIVRLLIEYGADVRKIAVHKDKKQSFSTLSLLALYASECGKTGISNVEPIVNLLLEAGASFTQVDTSNKTCWHYLAMISDNLDWNALPIFLDAAKTHVSDTRMKALDTIDDSLNTPIYIATSLGNHKSIKLLLSHGASPYFSEEKWTNMKVSTNRFYQVMTNDIRDAMLRSPIFLAATKADTKSLAAYYDIDQACLNNPVTKYIDNSNTPQFRGHFAVRIATDRPTKKVRILDVLNNILKIQNNQENSSKTISSWYMERIDHTKEMVTKIEEKLAISKKKSPTSIDTLLWSIMLGREEMNLKQVSSYHSNNDDDDNEESFEARKEKSIAQIKEAIAFVKERGGETEPCKKQEEIAEENEARFQHMQTPNTTISDPMTNFCEISFNGFQTNFSYHRNTGNLSSAHVDKVAENFRLVYSGKNTELSHAVKYAKVCVMSVVGEITPFYLAVMRENVEASKKIFDEGVIQYKRHNDAKEAAQKRKKEREEEVNSRMKSHIEKKHPIQGLVNRINNLELATGDLPNMVAGPDTMRFELDNAETRILDDDSIEKAVSSSIPPEALLLHRSNFLLDDSLCELKKNFDFEKKKCISLRPIELAVLRGDVSMVNTLITLAQSINYSTSKNTTVNESNNAFHESDIENSDYEDSDLDDGAHEQNSTTNLSEDQLRYSLVGPGSLNNDLDGKSLIELAIEMDDVEIFRSIASFAKEFALPLNLINHWKTQHDSSKKVEENENKSAGHKDWGFGSFGRSHYSPLHYIMKCSSKKLINAVIAHTMDDVLVDWLFQDRYVAPKAFPTEIYCLKPFYDAANWLSFQIFDLNTSKEEVAGKLCRVITTDSNLRSPLFYVSSDLVSSIAKEGAKYISSITPDLKDAKPKFVNSVTSNGVSALMVAASLGDKAKVQMLIREGAIRSLSTSGEGWNVLHFVISKLPHCKREFGSGLKSDEKEKWTNTLEMIEILLKDADDSELDEMLLSSKAEHTPLMLAVSKDADEKVASFLIEKTALRAANSLSRRDKDMNSVLHLAVKAILTKEKFSLGIIKALLAQPTMVSHAENARGLTASDISLESVLSIWENNSTSQYCHANAMIDLSSKQLKPPRFNEIDYEKTIKRRDLFDVLISAETGKRITVGFGEVKIDANNASESARIQPGVSEHKATSLDDCTLP